MTVAVHCLHKAILLLSITFTNTVCYVFFIDLSDSQLYRAAKTWDETANVFTDTQNEILDDAYPQFSTPSDMEDDNDVWRNLINQQPEPQATHDTPKPTGELPASETFGKL